MLPALPANLLRRLQNAIAAREYEANEIGQGLQAPNRAQGLRTYFEPSGIRVMDRTAEGAPELARLTLSGVGHEGSLTPVASGEVSHRGPRVEIRRPGLVEWYENGPEGLEQGFTLAHAPAGSGALIIELAIGGAETRLAGDSLVLVAPGGRRLHYGALRASDSAGRALPAHLELAGGRAARLVVDDRSARYPIEIDPVLTGTFDAYIRGSVPDALLGDSVASAGDTNGDGYDDIIVGAPWFDSSNKEGAAGIFLGGPDGIASGGELLTAWTFLRSSRPQSLFGLSVASAGDVNGDGYADVIVAAPGYTDGQTNEGAAFIFLGGPNGIADHVASSADTELRGGAWNAQVAAGFHGAASAGDVNGDGYADVIVGAPFYGGGGSPDPNAPGAAFVFLGGPTGVPSGTMLNAATVLSPGPGLPPNGFGNVVASAGDVDGDGYDDVIVGASGGDYTFLGGSAFIFRGSPTGIASVSSASAATQLSSSDPEFAQSVASAGDVNGDGYADVIVGSLTQASLFLGSATGVPSESDASATTLSCTQSSAYFGLSVASAGDVNGDGFSDVVVGAPAYSRASGDERGSSFVYFGSAGGLVSGNETTASATLAGGRVASAGDVNGDGFADVITGAPSLSFGQPAEGVAFVYLGGAAGLRGASLATAGKAESNQPNAQLGTSVASAGDVNGDGYSDLIVGAPFYDSGESDEGAAFIFSGGPAGVAAGNPANAATILQSNQAGAQLGASVASAGDVNGDGYSDVIVGAPFYDDPNHTDEGAAFVFLGSATGVAAGSPSNAHASFESHQTGAQLGTSVSSAGDVNGDGRSDVIVGAPFYTATNSGGAAFVFLSGPSGLANGTPASAQATITADENGAQMGTVVASAGDVNGDGFGDVIVSAPHYVVMGVVAGNAYIVRGSSAGIDPNALTLIGGAKQSALGTSVAGAGDLNGDGYDDVIVGAPAPGTTAAAAYVFNGAASLPFNYTTPASVLTDSASGSEFGHAVAGIGDVNGDGYPDVAVSSETGNGALWIFNGGPGGVPSGSQATAALEIDADESLSRFGNSVAGAGDVNGDGFADVVVGAPLYDNSQADEGLAFVFYGGNRHGRPVLARERRGDGSGVLAQTWGDARRGNAFVAQISGTHPAGRGRVKAQAEACPQLVAFGSPSCVSGTSPAWIAVNPASLSAPLSVTLTGLPPNRLIHWRARVLRADATEALPVTPGHGPWRTLEARDSNEAIRTSRDADLDAIPDGLDNCPYRANPGQEDAGGLGAASPPDGIGDVCQCGNVAGDGHVAPDDVSAYRLSLANPSGAPLSPDAHSRCVVLGSGTACNVLQVSAIRRGVHVPPLAPLTSSAAAQVCAASHP